MNIRKWLSILSAFVLLIGLNWWLDICLEGQNFWDGTWLSKAATENEYCELNRMANFLRQPMNSYSNIAFVVAGLFLLPFWHRPSAVPLPLQWTMSLMLLLLGYGSWYFHASLYYPAQRVDMAGTYGVIICLLAILINRLVQRGQRLPLLLSIIVVSISITYIFIRLQPNSGILVPTLVGALILFTSILHFRNPGRFDLRWAIAGLSFMIAAGVLRTLDVMKVGCNPESWWQGHSAWHVLTAASAFTLFHYFSKEREASST